MAATQKNTSTLLIVNADPRISGVSAPIGSTARSSVDGSIYQKTGALSTDWLDISLNGGVGEYIRATSTKGDAGRREFSGTSAAALSTQALATGIIAAWPMWPWGGAYAQMGFETTAITVLGNSRVGIYDENAFGLPGNLIFDSGNIATTILGIKNVGGVPTLARKRYWACLTQSVSTTYRGLQWDPATTDCLSWNPTGVNVPRYITAPFTFGALPATFPSPISYVSGGAGIAKPATWLIF